VTRTWGDVFAAIGRRPVSWMVAVVFASLCWAVLLLTAVMAWSLRPTAERISIAPEATVVLSSGTTAAQVDSLRNALSALAQIAATRFVSSEKALAQVAARSAANRDAIGQLVANPLPDTVVLSFRTGTSPEAVDSTAAAIRKMARVDSVELDSNWYRKLWAMAAIGTVALVALGAALLAQAAAWLTVAIVVSGPVDPHGVQLMRLLGADERAVRRGPVAAAAITSLIVAALALVLARVGWQWLQVRVGSVGRLYGTTVELQWPDPAWLIAFAVALLVVGLVLGSLRARLLAGRVGRSSGGWTFNG